MEKIFIDPGHGGKDPGALGNGLHEADVCLDIAKRVRELLESYEGVEVKLSREDDTYLGLTKRADMANAWGADIFLSIHQNAFNGTANGYEDYTYINTSQTTKDYQSTLRDEVYKAVSSLGDTPDRGMKSANYAVLRQTTMPAILTENCFIDSNGVDGDIITRDDFVDTMAQGHANGIVRIFDLGEPELIPIKGYGDEMLNPSNHALNKAVQQTLAAWEQDDKQPLSAQWRESFEKRELTVSDAVALLYLGHQRGYIKKLI